MTAQQAVLSLGALTLCGSGAGLVLIHGNNPLLKGLNWMGAALLVGGTASGLLLAALSWPWIQPLGNSCILLAFLCCNRADRYLMGIDPRRSRLSLLLIAIQAVACVLQWLHLIGEEGAIIGSCFVVGAQLLITAALIQGFAPSGNRVSVRATTALMRSLAATMLVRAFLAGAGLLTRSPFADTLNFGSECIFIAAAIALAFAFFWRATNKLSQELEHMASTDPLTRVYNRRVFLDWCESEQSRSRRLQGTFSVLMLDFDHFKQINDTFGHPVGDLVLCAAVERIQDSIRGIDVLCRWGGEEFTVLLPNASEEATLIVAERVRRNIRNLEQANPRFADAAFSTLHLTVSIGTATFAGDDDTHQLMLERADRALYDAKRGGRNRVVRSLRTRETLDPGPNPVALRAH